MSATIDRNVVVLEAKGMTKRFGGLIAVNSVDMKLFKNEILGLIGANGAGKTTMFNLLSGVLPASEGTLSYQGKEIPSPKADKMAKLGIGRTYQVCQPFGDMTVCENVMVGAFLHTRNPSVARREAMEILERLDMADRADAMGGALTLPELKRMEIARALSIRPDVLLLDEVLAGLNPTECDEMLKVIKGIRDEGMSIIMIEHIMRAIMSLSDRIVVMNEGRKIAEGLPEEIATNAEVIASYLGGSSHTAAAKVGDTNG